MQKVPSYPQADSWFLELPAGTRWSQLLRWIDRHDEMVYRLEDQELSLWLSPELGEGLLTVSPQDDQKLCLTTQHKGDLDRESVGAFLSEWWDLERDIEPFFQAFSEDPLLGPSIKKNRGARIVGFPNLFEALAIGILGQQVNVAFAYQLKQRFTQTFGESVEINSQTWWRFPQPEAVITASVDALRQMQISKRKAEYILGVAESMADGSLSKMQLMNLSWEDQMARLTALRGIGDWTAQYVGMKCLHSIQAFPAGDVGLQNAVKGLLKMERKPTPEELRELAQPWAGWEAYAAWYLWMS